MWLKPQQKDIRKGNSILRIVFKALHGTTLLLENRGLEIPQFKQIGSHS